MTQNLLNHWSPKEEHSLNILDTTIHFVLELQEWSLITLQ